MEPTRKVLRHLQCVTQNCERQSVVYNYFYLDFTQFFLPFELVFVGILKYLIWLFELEFQNKSFGQL